MDNTVDANVFETKLNKYLWASNKDLSLFKRLLADIAQIVDSALIHKDTTAMAIIYRLSIYQEFHASLISTNCLKRLAYLADVNYPDHIDTVITLLTILSNLCDQSQKFNLDLFNIITKFCEEKLSLQSIIAFVYRYRDLKRKKEIIMHVYNLLNCLITDRPKIKEQLIRSGLLHRAFEFASEFTKDSTCNRHQAKLAVSGYSREIMKDYFVEGLIHIIQEYYNWYPHDIFIDKMGFANYTKHDEGTANFGLKYCQNEADADRSWYWPIYDRICKHMGFPETALCLGLCRIVKEDETKKPIAILEIFRYVQQLTIDDDTLI